MVMSLMSVSHVVVCLFLGSGSSRDLRTSTVMALVSFSKNAWRPRSNEKPFVVLAAGWAAGEDE